MKKKITLPIAILAVTASLAISAYTQSRNNESISEIVEALLDGEDPPVLDDTNMWIWWVEEHYGGSAITCTFGGEKPCK